MTGGSRGIGKGISIELALRGAKVYITGRTLKSEGPLSLERTKEEITNVRPDAQVEIREVDHENDDQVRALFEEVVKNEGRGVDLLVNNCFSLPPEFSTSDASYLFRPFYEQSLSAYDSVINVGLRSHYVSTALAAPAMIKAVEEGRCPRGYGRVINVSSFGGLSYTFNVAYGVGKAGLDRFSADASLELKKSSIAVNSIYPGVVMTENMEKVVESGQWEEQVGIPVDMSETPRLTGRAIAALMTMDKEQAMERTGNIEIVSELASECGFCEPSGAEAPPSIRSLKFLLPSYGMSKELRESQVGKILSKTIPDWKLPLQIMAQGRPEDKKI